MIIGIDNNSTVGNNHHSDTIRSKFDDYCYYDLHSIFLLAVLLVLLLALLVFLLFALMSPSYYIHIHIVLIYLCMICICIALFWSHILGSARVSLCFVPQVGCHEPKVNDTL